jgi:hypothetical protein
LNPEPFCSEVYLAENLGLHEDYVEWARIRAGAADFMGPWFQSPLGSGGAACPACDEQHAGDPASFFWECPSLAEPRAWYLQNALGGGRAPEDKAGFLRSLLTADERGLPWALRFVGRAMRQRRNAGAAAAPNAGPNEEVECDAGPEEVSEDEDDEEDDECPY